MEFQDMLIEKVKENYKKELWLMDIFKSLEDKLHSLYDELSDFKRQGLLTSIEHNDDYNCKLIIQDYYLEFYLFEEYHYIQVSSGKESGTGRVIDQIRLRKEETSAFHNLEQDIHKSFDHYLKSAFEDVTFD